MSQQSDIHDDIVALCVANLASDYTQIPNPYFAEENPVLLLNKGFGVRIGPGTNTERFVNNCLVTWSRNYEIILTKQITTTQNNVGARENIGKAICDDVDLLWKKFELDPTLGGTVILARVLGDDGIGGIDVSGAKFLGTTIFLEVEYQEDPNT